MGEAEQTKIVRLNARIHNQREQIAHGHFVAGQLRARIALLEDALARHNCGKRVPTTCICVECCDIVDARDQISPHLTGGSHDS